MLDRQAGKGGLQVFTDEGGWEDAPFDPDAFTINIGDLMARWTGDRGVPAATGCSLRLPTSPPRN